MELWAADRVYVKGHFEQDWGVLVDKAGKIHAVGPRHQMVAEAKAVYHYPGAVLLPAMVNPHNHAFHRTFRGIPNLDISAQDLLKELWSLSQSIDDDLFEAACRISFAEQALTGIGTVGEFQYLHNGHHQESGQSGFSEKIVKIAVEMGMRLTLVYSFFDQGSMESAKAFIQPLDVSLDAFNALRQKYAEHPLIQIIPGVHSLEHTSPEAIIAASELAQKHDTKIHVQLAERENELESAQVQYGTTPLRALDLMGVLNERLVVINGTLLDEDELALMKKRGISAILCPSAAFARGDDFPNTSGLLQEQIPFAVGAGSAGMNHNYVVTEEIKWLELSQRNLQKSTNILKEQCDISSLWDLGTSVPAKMLNAHAAQLLPGTPADLVLVDMVQPTHTPQFPDNDHQLMNELVYSWKAAVAVSHLMVQGKMIVKNGMIQQDLSTYYQRLQQWNEAFSRSAEITIETESQETT